MLRDALDGCLRLKGDEPETAVLTALHLVAWHVDVQHVAKLSEVVLYIHIPLGVLPMPSNQDPTFLLSVLHKECPAAGDDPAEQSL